jgi:hypothetical protein
MIAVSRGGVPSKEYELYYLPKQRVLLAVPYQIKTSRRQKYEQLAVCKGLQRDVIYLY